MSRLLVLPLVLLALDLHAQTPAQMQKMQAAMDAQKPAGADAIAAAATDRPKRTAERLFATYEDLVANKPVPDITLDFSDYKSSSGKQEFIYVVENGATKKVDLKEVKYWGFTGPDGSIRRIFEGESFACLALGNKCYYQGRRPYNMESGNYYMRDWVSEGPTGPIEEGKRLVEDIIEAAGLKDAYKDAEPKREKHDSVDGYQDKLIDRHVVFMDRVNGESAFR